ncbi:MAG: envelope stress response membrane protein PspB [Acidocella sp.]|nr:envelope stress response membrane protein PspB [Acidocella sp.]
MSDNITSILLALFVIVLPTWMTFQYLTKARSGRRMSESEAQMMDQLLQTAARMETRMATLERILDAEVPGWRHTASAQGDYYGKMG